MRTSECGVLIKIHECDDAYNVWRATSKPTFSVKVVDTRCYWLMWSSGNLIPSILFWFALYWLELAAWSMCWHLLESICFHVILCWLRIEERDVHGSYSFMVGSHFPVVEFQVHFTGNPGSWLFWYPKKISRHEDIGLHKLPPSMLLLVTLFIKITKLRGWSLFMLKHSRLPTVVY